MAVTVSAGLQKKVGQPDYGSLGASCHVEFEIDRSMLDQNLDGFHQKVADAFAACRQAVNDQLAQQSGHSSPQPGNGQSNGIPHHTSHRDWGLCRWEPSRFDTYTYRRGVTR